VTLLHLAEILLYQYGKLGIEEFPGEITELASEIQASFSADTYEYRAADLALQTYALCRTKNSGSFAYVDELIPALRQAVADIPHNYVICVGDVGEYIRPTRIISTTSTFLSTLSKETPLRNCMGIS